MPESNNDQAYSGSQRRVPPPSLNQPLQLELRESASDTRSCMTCMFDKQLTSLYSTTICIISTAHHHPEAPGTPWIGSPLQPTLGGDFEDDEQQSQMHGDDDTGSSATSNIDVPLASNADASQPLHTSPPSHPLLADNAPASLITSDVIEDADSPMRNESTSSDSNANKEPRRSSSAWPSASEMDEEEFKDYLASLEIAKPKPRPRRKHLDRKMELARLKQQLVNILAYRTELLQSVNANSAPPDIQEATDVILRVHGLPSAAEVQHASNHPLHQSNELSARQIERPSSAPSTSSVRSNQASSTAASDSSNAEAIEEEIFAMNDEIQKLMISINELDKIKDPQIELSFTGPKQKNLQRARPDDDLWTEHTGRAPGIVSILSPTYTSDANEVQSAAAPPLRIWNRLRY